MRTDPPAEKPRVLRRARLSDQVFDWVLESIRGGVYGPDDLITEPSLATALETSRTPIREALFRLVGNGILTERGRGYCLPLLSRDEVADMFHTRLLVESDILRHLPATPDVRALKQASREEHDAIRADAPRDFIAANTRFRRALFDLCPNRFLTELADHCNDRMQAYRSVTLAEAANRAAVAQAHAEVVEALAQRDRDGAARLYLETLDRAQAAYAVVAEKGRT
ncbi:GntR family transcriptional regulator [Rhodobacter sp. NTK016B]|uniref:GntR family transcriptional regulator n=1 Tax=Rhodobacter sp. NTK016B TaxID=2759676 RepID=UPI001A8ECD4C|nr:GntR family transcriptional regulator [Rhodobacter sp. NTK016B]MBN8290636.1 GntR family transcriptional regulator [Rhodobacter sp. NTK016B]